jgi:hypothetical protein
VAILKEDRIAAIRRAEGRCEYCRTPLDYTPDPVVIDHILPATEGGVDTLDNLAASCWGCNGHKSAGTVAFDPQETRVVALFHPRRDSWKELFDWSADGLGIIGLTPIGRATVLKLNLNRQGLLNLRGVLKLAGKHPPK